MEINEIIQLSKWDNNKKDPANWNAYMLQEDSRIEVIWKTVMKTWTDKSAKSTKGKIRQTVFISFQIFSFAKSFTLFWSEKVFVIEIAIFS